jgi:hypothetical protein
MEDASICSIDDSIQEPGIVDSGIDPIRTFEEAKKHLDDLQDYLHRIETS